MTAKVPIRPFLRPLLPKPSVDVCPEPNANCPLTNDKRKKRDAKKKPLKSLPSTISPSLINKPRKRSTSRKSPDITISDPRVLINAPKTPAKLSNSAPSSPSVSAIKSESLWAAPTIDLPIMPLWEPPLDPPLEALSDLSSSSDSLTESLTLSPLDPILAFDIPKKHNLDEDLLLSDRTRIVGDYGQTSVEDEFFSLQSNYNEIPDDGPFSFLDNSINIDA